MRLVLVLALTAASLSCARPLAHPLVDATHFSDSLLVEMRYLGENNFVGAPVDGYEANRCLLTRPAARALARAAQDATSRGLRLLVYDCYRPQRAVDHFVRWASNDDLSTQASYYPTLSKASLFEQGYIARRSGHSRGSTVDVTLARLTDRGWQALDMGTPWDFFSEASHTASADLAPEQAARRRLLLEIMGGAGFVNYPKEWWHFTLADEPLADTYLDIPVR